LAPDIARFIRAGNATPAPAPSSSIAGRTSRTKMPSTGDVANRHSAAAISAMPGNTVLRAPNRITRGSE